MNYHFFIKYYQNGNKKRLNRKIERNEKKRKRGKSYSEEEKKK